jgi:tripartite-type tricarboxylate transporter receptor subunit TctC
VKGVASAASGGFGFRALTPILFAFFACLQGAAVAQEGKPLRFMVAFTPGGTADTIARLISQKIGELRGMQSIVENRGGANGTIGLEAFRSWPADGTSYSVISNSQVIAQMVSASVKWDLARDFEHILFLGDSPMVIAVNPARVSATTLDAALAAARAAPGRYAYGHCGPSSTHELAMELVKSHARVDIRSIAYRGCSPATTDAVGGQIDFLIASSPAVLPHVRAGKLRGLAITGAKRSAAAPDLPTVGESPGLKGVAMDNWYAPVAQRGTPKEAMARLEAAVREVMARPEVLERLAGAGIDVNLGGADVLRTAIADDIRNFRPIIERAGIKLD